MTLSSRGGKVVVSCNEGDNAMWLLILLPTLLILLLGAAYACFRFAFGVPRATGPYDFPNTPQYQAGPPVLFIAV